MSVARKKSLCVIDDPYVGKVTVYEVAYHRNGVGGMGFHVVAFAANPDGDETNEYVGIVFAREGKNGEAQSDECPTAVFDRKLLGDGIIAFGYNSHRGDYFENALLKAIDKHTDAVAKKYRLETIAQKRKAQQKG